MEMQAKNDYEKGLLAEERLLKMVEDGNPEFRQVKAAMGAIGNRLPIGDPLRHGKDMVIILTTLCSRAALRGGLSAEMAFSLSDRYLAEVEEAEDLEQVTDICDTMVEDFVDRVHRIRIGKGISPQIQASCDYISLHLEEKIDIHRLADRVGYVDYYFSYKFKKEVGMSVREYVMQQKIRRAKELLRDTHMEIGDISKTLGFGSQSYFGDLFRRETGYRPGEYRMERTRKRQENEGQFPQAGLE